MRAPITRLAAAGKVAGVFLALVFGAALFVQAVVAASDPQAPVQNFYSALHSTMQQGRVLGQSGRYAKLAPVVDRTFDIPYMTRLALGPAWNSLSAAEQQQLVAAFAHYVGATYADRFDTYSGEQLQVVGERPLGDDFMVQTRIVKANGEATRLDYRMRRDAGTWQISDVYLDGSISQLAVHRSEFHSILRRDGIDGLVMALNRKVDLLKNVARSS